MAKLDWGRGIGLHFKNNNEYYETLGFLTKRSRLVDIYTHDNGRSGAWGGQGKLETHVGTHILRNHGFTIEQDFAGNRYTYHLFPESLDVVVKSIESEEYEEDFFRGYNW